MKILRISVLTVFTLVFGVCLGLYIHLHMTVDNTYPVISIEDDVVHYTFEKTDSSGYIMFYSQYDSGTKAYSGVAAYDEKDGDLTKEVFVESVSKFTNPGECIITYAVCDNDRHITRAKRKIIFDGYSSPKFFLKKSLIFTQDELYLSDIFGAKDFIDGDISRDVIVTIPDLNQVDTSKLKIHAEVSNSFGDTSVIDIPVVQDNVDRDAPEIQLTDYLIYIEKGQKFTPQSYVKSASDKDGNPINTVSYKSAVDTSTEGLYQVDYYADGSGLKGHTILWVVVKEGVGNER